MPWKRPLLLKIALHNALILKITMQRISDSSRSRCYQYNMSRLSKQRRGGEREGGRGSEGERERGREGERGGRERERE